MTARALFSLSLRPLWSAIQRRYWKHIEQRNLMEACVEQQKANEAHRNAAYFQKQAAIARSKARES